MFPNTKREYGTDRSNAASAVRGDVCFIRITQWLTVFCSLHHVYEGKIRLGGLSAHVDHVQRLKLINRFRLNLILESV
jgi:hypothetical protein